MGERIEALLIDFDGTLVDSVPLLYHAYCHFVMIFGHWPSQEEFITMNGFTADEMVACMRTWRELDHPFETLLKLYKTLVKHQYHGAPIHKGAAEFVKWAHGRGYKLAVVTSAYKEWVEPLLEREGLRSQFDVIVSKEDINRGKPSPEGYQLALSKLKVAGSHALAVEDTPNGIESAISAGIRAVQFNSSGTYHALDSRALFFGNWQQIQHFIEEEE